MIYADLAEIDASTGIITSVPVTNAWVLANRPSTVLLSLDKAQIIANGADSAILSIQIRTPMLTDGSYENAAVSQTVTLQVEDQSMNVETDGNGFASLPISAVATGSYDISSTSHPSNQLVLEAI